MNPAPKILVLGLGNDILSDDAIGLRAVREAGQHLAAWPEVELRETQEMGLALLDHLVGYDAVVLVDSIQMGGVPAGTIHQLDPAELPRIVTSAPHFVGVGETLRLGSALDLPMPTQLRILAVEVADPYTLGTQLTEPVENALPNVIDAIVRSVAALRDVQWAPTSAAVSNCASQS